MDNFNKNCAALILAAGRGTRMQSDVPKVLHVLHGKTMLEHVLWAVNKAGIQDVCLVLSKETLAYLKTHALKLKEDLNSSHVKIALQLKAKGTADAVAASADCFKAAKRVSYFDGEAVSLRDSESNAGGIESQYVLICAGDTPALDPKELQSFISWAIAQNLDLAVLGFYPEKAEGYGRVLHDSEHFVEKIVEEKDANLQEKQERLCNTGIYFARIQKLFLWLDEISPQNVQKEYYLTDILSIARSQGEKPKVYCAKNSLGFYGINDRAQLLQVEDFLKCVGRN